MGRRGAAKTGRRSGVAPRFQRMVHVGKPGRSLPLFVLLSLLGLAACGTGAERNRAEATPAVAPSLPYAEIVTGIEGHRRELGEAYRAAESTAERARIRGEARDYLARVVRDDLFPRWYGTPWDYNGTTQTPGEGAIACGYFVTTVLRDAGFRLERVRLAQVPSETMIKALVPETQIRRFSDVSLEDFVAAVRDEGPGLFLVGLDLHTGFLVNEAGEVSFVHASYVPPRRVFREPALTSPILGASRYRVVGKLTGSDRVLERWLAG